MLFVNTQLLTFILYFFFCLYFQSFVRQTGCVTSSGLNAWETLRAETAIVTVTNSSGVTLT